MSTPDNQPTKGTEVDPIEQSLATSARVMMVDDEPILIELVRAFLEEAGYLDFIGVSDPTEAIPTLQDQKPDVLLLDLMMPKVNGFQILEQVKADAETRMLPVIVMTSASDADTKLKVLEMGATDFLEKPVDPSELVLRLRNTLAFKAHRDRLTYFDGLTNLPNRRLFMNQFESAISRSKRSNKMCAFLQIELNGVKKINALVGRRVGDQVVQTISARIQSCIKSVESRGTEQIKYSLARFGSDEFALLMQGLDNIDQAAEVARKINRVVEPFIPHEGVELRVNSAIGISACPMDSDNSDALLQGAQAALPSARNKGIHSYAFFSSELNQKALQQLNMERDLRKALNRDEFVLYYQPKVDISEERICGAEALIRWVHPEHGLIPPGQFIPMAEELGLIVDIGTWVLKQACIDAAAWRDEGITDCTVAVNISAPHFSNGRLLQDVQEALSETGLSPSMLTIELTESMMMDHSDDTVLTLDSLKTLGIRTAIDDFGTGYSSLSNLKRMRLDELKIDQSFVSGIPEDTDSCAIVRAVLAMSRSLGFEITAEGVEQEEQLEFLRSFNCDVYQGFLCSQPIPAPNFVNLLRQQYVPRGVEVNEGAD